MTTSTGKLGIGVLGGGGEAAEGHIRGFQSDARAQVVALWDIDQAKVSAQAARLGVSQVCSTMEELLGNAAIDIIAVCTPDHLHAEHALAALAAEKHVLCEKPMCTTRRDAAELVRAVRSAGKVFLAGHNYHFVPHYRAMAEAYRSGEIGQVWLAEGDYISNLHEFYAGRTPWRSDATAAQDILMGGGCHPLGLMCWAMRSKVTEVFAYSNHLSEKLLPLDDAYVMALKFDNGAMGKLIAASGNRGYAPTGGHLVLYGTQGTIWGGKLYRQDPSTHQNQVVRDFRAELAHLRPRVADTKQVHYWAEQAEHFLDCVQGRSEPQMSVLDAARVVAALEAGVRSARSGQPVAVDNQF
jgi:predicted dehydrogenase